MNYGYFEEEADFYMGSKGGGGEEEVLRRAQTIAQIEGLVGLKREQASLQSTFQQGSLVGEKKREFSCVKSGGNVAVSVMSGLDLFVLSLQIKATRVY